MSKAEKVKYGILFYKLAYQELLLRNVHFTQAF